jgi:hypothetical protein
VRLDWRRWLDRFGVAMVYTAGLGAATALLHSRPRAQRSAWLDWASTAVSLREASDLRPAPVRRRERPAARAAS